MSYDRRIAGKAKDLVHLERKAEFTQGESEYRALCENIPVLLRTAGLLQTAVFLEAKGGHPHGTFSAHLNEQLRGLEYLGEKETIAVLAASPTQVSTAHYRLLTQIAARIAYWHKRMAQAYLRTKKAGGPL